MLNNFFTRHSFKIILVVLFLLPVLGRGARKALLSNDNDVHDWLPDTYAETNDFSWFQQHFDNETFVLVTWEGCNLEDERLELFAKKVIPPEKPADQQAQAIRKPEPPKKPWWNDLFFAGWLKKPQKVDLATSGPLFKSIETGQRLVDRLVTPPITLPEDAALGRLQGLFVGPPIEGKPNNERQTCAVITLTAEGKRDLRVTLEEVYRIATEELGLPRERVKLGGPPVDNVAISVEGEKTLIRLFIPAGIVGLSLAFWCLRSVRLTAMVFATALYAGAISLAVVHYTGDAMNAILLTMPAVVYVAGISGAIHFGNYYRDSVTEHGVEGAPTQGAQTCVPAVHVGHGHHGCGAGVAVHKRAGADPDVRGLFGGRCRSDAGLVVLVLAVVDATVAHEAAQLARRQPAQGGRHRTAGARFARFWSECSTITAWCS